MADDFPEKASSKNSAPENSAPVNSSAGLSFPMRNRLWIAVGTVLIVASTALILIGRFPALADRDNAQELPGNALSVNILTVQETDHYQVKQKYSGAITAGRQSDHGFDTGGLLAEVLVDEGDEVKKGDILARLDGRRLDARAQELEADLSRSIALDKEAMARLDQAKANYSRSRILVGKKQISEQKFDQAKFDLIALKAHKIATKAAVTRSKAAVKSLEINRDLEELVARFDGSVVRRYQDEGTALAAGTPVIRLIEDENLEIHVGLPLSALSSFKVGEPYIFDYQGGKITTELRAILKNIDQATRTVTALFDVTDRNSNIYPGALARLTITSDIRQNGFWLPLDALAESRRGLWSAYSLTPYQGSREYGILSRQELQLLSTDSDRVFVRGTIQNGDRIVTGGLHRLVPGQLVRIKRGP